MTPIFGKRRLWTFLGFVSSVGLVGSVRAVFNALLEIDAFLFLRSRNPYLLSI
jgi:hypothetical protein